MIADEQIAEWFKYHNVPENRARHKGVNDEAARAREVFVQAFNHPHQVQPGENAKQESFDAVNTAGAAFARAINTLAPDGADKTTAVRQVRLARMKANKAIMDNRFGWLEDALADLDIAAMWANAAIALDAGAAVTP